MIHELKEKFLPDAAGAKSMQEAFVRLQNSNKVSFPLLPLPGSPSSSSKAVVVPAFPPLAPAWKDRPAPYQAKGKEKGKGKGKGKGKTTPSTMPKELEGMKTKTCRCTFVMGLQHFKGL